MPESHSGRRLLGAFEARAEVLDLGQHASIGCPLWSPDQPNASSEPTAVPSAEIILRRREVKPPEPLPGSPFQAQAPSRERTSQPTPHSSKLRAPTQRPPTALVLISQSDWYCIQLETYSCRR